MQKETYKHNYSLVDKHTLRFWIKIRDSLKYETFHIRIPNKVNKRTLLELLTYFYPNKYYISYKHYIELNKTKTDKPDFHHVSGFDSSNKNDEAPKFDDGKARFDLIPPYPLWEVCKVYNMGCNNKYPKRSWEKGMEWGRIIAAVFRHILCFMSGESKDKEDGLHHLAHAVWGLLTIMEYEATGAGIDDRSKNKTLQHMINNKKYKLTWSMEDFNDSNTSR